MCQPLTGLVLQTDSVTWSPGVWLFCDCEEDLQRTFTGETSSQPYVEQGQTMDLHWAREDQGPFTSPSTSVTLW